MISYKEFLKMDIKERAKLVLTAKTAAKEYGMIKKQNDYTKQQMNDYTYDIDNKENALNEEGGRKRIHLKRRIPTVKVGNTRIIFRDVMEDWKGNKVRDWDEETIRKRAAMLLTLSVAAEQIGMKKQQLNRYMYDIFDSSKNPYGFKKTLPSFLVGESRRFVFSDVLDSWYEENFPK